MPYSGAAYLVCIGERKYPSPAVTWLEDLHMPIIDYPRMNLACYPGPDSDTLRVTLC